jgi:ketosteroid isomerase-like protein
MKSYLAYFFVSLQLGLLSSIAQEPSATKNGQPSPEMQKLFDAFGGRWSLTETIEPNEKSPNGGSGRGEVVNRLGPGGRSSIEEIHLVEPTGEVSGLGLAWWDKKAGGYRTVWCENQNPRGCIVMARVAKWENDQFVLGDEFEISGKKFVFKEVLSEITPTSYTQTLYQGEAGKELKKLLTIHASRQSSGASSSDTKDKDQMSAESNKALLRRAIDIWSAGNLSAVDEIVAPEYVGHVSTGDRDKQALRQRIEAFHRLYSQMAFHVEDQMADGDKVITRLSAVVTRRDTGKSAKLIGINISRVVRGKIVEEWNTWEPVTIDQSSKETR